jgi:hypothetical protein
MQVILVDPLPVAVAIGAVLLVLTRRRQGSSDPAHRPVHRHIEPEAGTLGTVRYTVGDLVAAEKLFTRCLDLSGELSCKPSLFETVTPVSADSP